MRSFAPGAGLVLVLAAALAAGAGPACAPGPGGGAVGHGVLLVAVDGLRADHLPLFGYDRRTMPRLADLAQEGWYVEGAFAAAPQLIPSHAALMTGCDPNLARRDVPQWLAASLEQAWRIPDGLPRLGVEFLVGGHATAAFSDHPDFAPVYGFGAGFQSFEKLWREDLPAQPGVERAAARVRQWVRSLARERPWFAYAHLGDLERVWNLPDARWDSYFPPRPSLDFVPPVGAGEPALFAVPPSRWSGGSTTLGEYQARYDGALRRLDDALHRLFEELAADGRLEHTTICVVGTFGVQFGEAGLVLDKGRLSMADLFVPLIVRPAPALHGGRFRPGRLAGIASTMDVAPTLLQLAGLERPSGMQGLSLVDASAAGAPSPREQAFASCAIQAGYAAFTRERALEVLFPGEVTHPRLMTGWFGDLNDHASSARERFYDWRAEPFPPLDAPARFEAAETVAIRQAAHHWTTAIEALRRRLQQPQATW